MYKNSNFLIIVFLILFLIGCGLIKKPLVQMKASVVSAEEDVNLLKNQVTGLQKNIAGLEAENFDLKIKLQNEISIYGQLKAQLELKSQMVAGFQNEIKEVKMTANRDIVQNTQTINDTKLLIYVFGGLFSLMTMISTYLFKALRAKDIWLKNLIKSNDEKERKLDEWQTQFIEKMVDKKV